MSNDKTYKIFIILFGVLYLIIGLGYLVGGASPDSRFFMLDNLLIRVIGALLIASSIGVLLKKEIARKGIIAGLILSIIEIFIGIPRDINIIEFISGVWIMMVLYVPGLVYFILLGDKEYFN